MSTSDKKDDPPVVAATEAAEEAELENPLSSSRGEPEQAIESTPLDDENGRDDDDNQHNVDPQEEEEPPHVLGSLIVDQNDDEEDAESRRPVFEIEFVRQEDDDEKQQASNASLSLQLQSTLEESHNNDKDDDDDLSLTDDVLEVAPAYHQKDDNGDGDDHSYDADHDNRLTDDNPWTDDDDHDNPPLDEPTTPLVTNLASSTVSSSSPLGQTNLFLPTLPPQPERQPPQQHTAATGAARPSYSSAALSASHRAMKSSSSPKTPHHHHHRPHALKRGSSSAEPRNANVRRRQQFMKHLNRPLRATANVVNWPALQPQGSADDDHENETEEGTYPTTPTQVRSSSTQQATKLEFPEENKEEEGEEEEQQHYDEENPPAAIQQGEDAETLDHLQKDDNDDPKNKDVEAQPTNSSSTILRNNHRHASSTSDAPSSSPVQHSRQDKDNDNDDMAVKEDSVRLPQLRQRVTQYNLTKRDRHRHHQRRNSSCGLGWCGFGRSSSSSQWRRPRRPGTIRKKQSSLSSLSHSPTDLHYGGGACSWLGITLHSWVVHYLHWSFRSSFAAVFLSAAVGFLVLTLLFAAVLYGLGHHHPKCLGGVDFYEADYFTDAFVLSWTTFSTVGYGLIYSGISADEPDIRKCTGMTIVVTLEAFVGVLYAAFCGAVVFAKVTRTQSVAQVAFSTPIVIRYGSGVSIETTNQNNQNPSSGSTSGSSRRFLGNSLSSTAVVPPSSSNNLGAGGKEETVDDTRAQQQQVGGRTRTRRVKQVSDNSVTDMLFLQDTQRLPCPILEFRIANRLCSVEGGELLDAAVNIVASIDASQACHTVHAQLQQQKRRRRRKKNRGHRSNDVMSAKACMALQQELEKEQEKQPHWMDREEYLSHASELLSNFSSSRPRSSQYNGRASHHHGRMSHHGGRASHYGSSWRDNGPMSSLSSSYQYHQGMNSSLTDSQALSPTTPTGTAASQQKKQSSTHQAFEEDPTGHLVPRRIFSKLEVDTFEHPFFEHVWTVRHVLDDRSPLLRTAAREMVQANGGFWPVELNSAQGVRSAVHFDQILVSLSGTSNADANAVYAQNVYEWVDLIVGYRFANMMYRIGPSKQGKKKKDPKKDGDAANDSSSDSSDVEDEEEWRVDLRLINDVSEQAGGGGEAFNGAVQETFGDHLADMLIL